FSSYPIGILFAPRILKAILHCASTERITSLSDHKRTKMATLTQILRCIEQDLERFPVIKDVVIEASDRDYIVHVTVDSSVKQEPPWPESLESGLRKIQHTTNGSPADPSQDARSSGPRS